MARGANIGTLGVQNNLENNNRGNPFSLAFGAEVMLPVEIEVPSFRQENYNEESNSIQMVAEAVLIDERRDQARSIPIESSQIL